MDLAQLELVLVLEGEGFVGVAVHEDVYLFYVVGAGGLLHSEHLENNIWGRDRGWGMGVGDRDMGGGEWVIKGKDWEFLEGGFEIGIYWSDRSRFMVVLCSTRLFLWRNIEVTINNRRSVLISRYVICIKNVWLNSRLREDPIVHQTGQLPKPLILR